MNNFKSESGLHLPAEIVSVLDVAKEQHAGVGVEEHKEEHAGDNEETLDHRLHDRLEQHLQRGLKNRGKPM